MRLFKLALVLLSAILFFAVPGGASENCKPNPLGKDSIAALENYITRLVTHLEKQGTLVRDANRFHPEEFACEAGNAFFAFSRSNYDDFNMARRPIYLLRALRHLGILQIKAKNSGAGSELVTFINQLIDLVKASGFPDLDYMTLSQFGLINPVEILALANEMNFSTKDNWFTITINTRCKGECKISLKGLELTITGLNVGNAKVKTQVTFSFFDGANLDNFKDAVNQDMNGGALGLNYVHKDIRSHLGDATYFAGQQSGQFRDRFLPRPVYVKVNGLEFDGFYAHLPINGKLRSLFILPFLSEGVYSSPLVVKMDGAAAKIIRGHVLVSDYIPE